MCVLLCSVQRVKTCFFIQLVRVRTQGHLVFPWQPTYPRTQPFPFPHPPPLLPRLPLIITIRRYIYCAQKKIMIILLYNFFVCLQYIRTLCKNVYNEKCRVKLLCALQVLSEKAKLAKTIREYNRKTTPVNHIHIKGVHSVSVCLFVVVCL